MELVVGVEVLGFELSEEGLGDDVFVDLVVEEVLLEGSSRDLVVEIVQGLERASGGETVTVGDELVESDLDHAVGLVAVDVDAAIAGTIELLEVEVGTVGGEPVLSDLSVASQAVENLSIAEERASAIYAVGLLVGRCVLDSRADVGLIANAVDICSSLVVGYVLCVPENTVVDDPSVELCLRVELVLLVDVAVEILPGVLIFLLDEGPEALFPVQDAVGLLTERSALELSELLHSIAFPVVCVEESFDDAKLHVFDESLCDLLVVHDESDLTCGGFHEFVFHGEAKAIADEALCALLQLRFDVANNAEMRHLIGEMGSEDHLVLGEGDVVGVLHGEDVVDEEVVGGEHGEREGVGDVPAWVQDEIRRHGPCGGSPVLESLDGVEVGDRSEERRERRRCERLRSHADRGGIGEESCSQFHRGCHFLLYTGGDSTV